MSIAYHLRDSTDPPGQPGVRLSGVVQNATFLIAIIAMVFAIAMS
jgi:hypothetical protein